MKKLLSSILFFMLLYSGCKSKKPNVDPDPELPDKPVIEIISVLPVVGSGVVCGMEDHRTVRLNSSDVFRLEFNLKAKEGLSQYKIDLHNNFDCHSHRIAMNSGYAINSSNQRSSSTNWKILRIVDVEGQQKTILENIPVPLDVTAGNYHFMIQCVDTKGNEAEFVIYNLNVGNTGDTEKPVIQMNSPAVDSIGLHKGDLLEFSVNISDNKNLDGGRIEVTYFNPSNTEFTVDQYYFPDGEGESGVYEYDYTIPVHIPSTGIHVFVLKVYDNAGNFSEKHIKVNILS